MWKTQTHLLFIPDTKDFLHKTSVSCVSGGCITPGQELKTFFYTKANILNPSDLNQHQFVWISEKQVVGRDEGSSLSQQELIIGRKMSSAYKTIRLRRVTWTGVIPPNETGATPANTTSVCNFWSCRKPDFRVRVSSPLFCLSGGELILTVVNQLHRKLLSSKEANLAPFSTRTFDTYSSACRLLPVIYILTD